MALNELEVEYGADLLVRSAVWLTIKESRASFAIEHEEKQVDRIKRFAAAMAERCGKGNDPLDVKELTDLQTAILGRATATGFASLRCLSAIPAATPRSSTTWHPAGIRPVRF